MRVLKVYLISPRIVHTLRRKCGEPFAMKLIWIILNIIQALIILGWTAFCGIFGILLMLVLWNRGLVIYIMSRIIWSPVICLVSGVRVKKFGVEKIDRKSSFIYVANHSSLYDIVALSRVMPVPLFFIAKQELKKVPFLGWYMIVLGHIFVDRKNKDKAMESMREAARRINAGQNVISFPEGTRSKTDEVQMFKRGSFIIAKEGDIPIVPIGIVGARKILRSGSYDLRPGTIEVHVGEAISPEQFRDMTIESLASLARERVIKEMQV